MTDRAVWTRGRGYGGTTFGAPGRSLPPELGLGRRMDGMRPSKREADRPVDPMSLVASPSRGTDPASSNSLLSPAFQQSFHSHLRRRLASHRASYPNPLAPLIRHALELDALDGVDAAAKAQVVSGQQLVGEWRKLREGIVASGRTDDFAVTVYEESADLALETLDWAQLASLLPYLVNVLHPAQRSLSSTLEGLSLVADGPSSSTADRHASFAAALLILPVALRLDLADFCPLYVSLTSSGTPKDHPHILFAWRLFRIVRRGDWVRLSRVLQDVDLPFDPASSSTDIPVHHRLLYALLPVFRKRMVWPVLRKAFYQLSDPGHVGRCLALAGSEDRVGRWTEKVGGIMMSNEKVLVFREVARKA